MQTFISETIQDILKTTQTFENTVFILPSQRAKIFVKQEIKKEISVGFLPNILTIEEFISQVSGIKKIDSVQLLFHFYTIYKQQEKNPDSFDKFSSWAFTVLQDFNEIDQHLINTQDIFVYLRDIQRLRKWSVKGTFQETELMKDHYSFIEKLNDFYKAFYHFLVENRIGYQGILYREAVKNIDLFLEKNQTEDFFFIGFNALNKSEEFLFQKLLSEGKTQVYWDIDVAFLENNHQAGNFIRKYKKEWKFYEKNELKSVGNWFSKDKNIQLIGASKNITQIKYAGEILSNLSKHNNTALVLADETLLPITLNSLPQNVEAINITMGYPLKDIPATSLFLSIFQLFLTQEKLQKTEDNLFYHKDLIRFFKEASIYNSLSDNEKSISDEIAMQIVKENNTFVSKEYIVSFLENFSKNEITRTISSVFEQFLRVDEFLVRITNLIVALKENSNELEKEYLFRFYGVFTQLQNLHSEFGYFTDLKTLHHFFKQLITSEVLSFQGEPLQGLQLMGMLETRVLDFENIILTSVNEGILPANSQQNSFIPFDVKIAFGLPTYKEKDAVFSYHFFRLIQRAKNIYLLYNTENDNFGKGEKSRFITQLELSKENIQLKTVSPRVITEKPELQKVKKNKLVLEKLKELAKNGISPSALASYLYNPIEFYKQKILKIREFEEVEEEIEFRVLGTVVHETLDDLYRPFEGKFIVLEDVVKMQKEIKPLVKKHFDNYFKNGDVSTGKNRLVFEVTIRFIENFLRKEKELLKNKKNQLKIIATEQTLSATIKIKNIDFPIKIHGQVDRIDQLNGVIRIIDYKTGMVRAIELKVSDLQGVCEYKYAKAIQVLLYTFLYVNSKGYDKKIPLQAGVFSFKNLKNGFLQLNFSSNRTADNLVTQERISEFMKEIKHLLQEIFDIEESFEEPLELPF